jgi:hypothetical protein
MSFLGDLFGGGIGALAGFAVGGSLGALIGGSSGLSASAAQSAAQTQANAANQATAAQQAMFGKTQQDIAPFVQGGQAAIGQLGTPGMQDYLTHQFTAADLNATMSPGYEFARTRGLRAVGNAAGVTGSLVGGNAQQGAANYAENLANTYYQNAFQDYQTQRSNIFGQLYSIAGLGSNAAVGQGTIGANVGGNIANTITGAGNAQAAGTVGAANAISSGIGSYLGYSWLTNQGQGSPGSSLSYLGAPNSSSLFGGTLQPPAIGTVQAGG